MNTWPAHYPEQCPPKNAKPVAGKIYRFTSRPNPNIKDFYSHFDRDPHRDWGDQSCQSRGLSVFTSEEDCKKAILKIPALKKKKLASANLNQEKGVIAKTPSNNIKAHFTLWPLITTQELSLLFSTVGEEVSNNA